MLRLSLTRLFVSVMQTFGVNSAQDVRFRVHIHRQFDRPDKGIFDPERTLTTTKRSPRIPLRNVMLETSNNRCVNPLVEASAHVLAVTPGAHYLEYLDVAGTVLHHAPEIEDGALRPCGPGLGIEWSKEAVEKYAV